MCCKMLSIISTSLVLLMSTLAVNSNSPLAHGFGDNINWKSLQDGLASAKLSQKPVMVLIHKSYCPACHELSPQFAASKEIADRASNFEMVNIYDDEEPEDVKYAPDGDYVPRILFFHSNGEFQSQIFNPKSSTKYRHYYYDAPNIVNAMDAALKKQA
uniref:Thioredoxin domain-containing protein 12 n=2 Tax=Cacopsylla melanoneura TaxID=428564 RepID=A0A8D8TK44_9HEMI